MNCLKYRKLILDRTLKWYREIPLGDRRFLFSVGLAVVLALFIAEGNASASQAQSAVVRIYGNNAVNDETVLRMTGLAESPNQSVEDVKRRLQTTALFSSVEVFRTAGEVSIYLREKTTWFVLPYFSKDPAAVLYGLAFGKVTIDGQDAKVFGRVQHGTGNRAASFLVRNDAVFGSRWMLGASFDYSDQLFRVFGGSDGREVIHRTASRNLGGSVQAAYRVSPAVSIGLNNYVERRRFEELSGEIRSGLQWSHRLLGEYRRLFNNEGLVDGHLVRAHIEATNPLSDFEFIKYGLASQYGAFRRGNLNWIIRGVAEYSPNLPRYQLFTLGGGLLRSFPREIFRSEYYGRIQNDLLLTSLNFWKFRLRPLLYADWAYIDNGGRTGVGTGFQIYVRDVAIPAVQLFMGYGFHPNGFAVAAAIGPQI